MKGILKDPGQSPEVVKRQQQDVVAKLIDARERVPCTLTTSRSRRVRWERLASVGREERELWGSSPEVEFFL